MINYLLIWDIDGTLTRIEGVGVKAIEKTFLELYGVENALKGISLVGMIDSIVLKKLFELFDIKVADRNAFFTRYPEILKAELEKLGSSTVLPGVKTLLEYLKNCRCFYNVLGTGNVEKGARIKLEYAKLNSYFHTGGFGDEEVERWKLIKKAILNASKYYKIKFENEHTYIIGDTPSDMECGEKLGVKTIGVATGPYSIDELSGFGADYVFENLLDKESFLRIFK
jgi:phosphoglycolate phosphatase